MGGDIMIFHLWEDAMLLITNGSCTLICTVETLQTLSLEAWIIHYTDTVTALREVSTL